MICDDDKQWTRLIDGELSYSEQRALLLTLDETPDGWKRLALGLLEAEAFRRELRDIASPTNPGVGTMPLQSTKPVLQRRMQPAIACMIGLICLGLGMGIEHRLQPIAAFADPAQPVTPIATAAGLMPQTMKLVFADGPAGGQSVEVPVIDAEGAGVAELLRQSAVPDEWRQRMEAQGYVIHEERKYVPVSLTNGRQGIAPISDVVVEHQPVAFQ